MEEEEKTLFKILYFGTLEDLKSFINSGVNISNIQNSIFDATSCEQLKFLIQSGFNVNVIDRYGISRLTYAKTFEETKLLLDLGADPNIGLTSSPLCTANYKQAVLLLINGADPNKKDHRGLKPIHSIHDRKIIKLLFDCGTNLNNKELFKLLSYQMMYNNVDLLIELFIKHNFNLSVKDDNGDTLLHKRIGKNNIKRLIQSGVDVNIKNKYGDTPLHLVNDIETCNIILEKSCKSLFTRNNYGEFPDQSVLRHITINNHLKIIRLFLTVHRIKSFQNIYRNRLMNPNHPFCKRKLDRDYKYFQQSYLKNKDN